MRLLLPRKPLWVLRATRICNNQSGAAGDGLPRFTPLTGCGTGQRNGYIHTL